MQDTEEQRTHGLRELLVDFNSKLDVTFDKFLCEVQNKVNEFKYPPRRGEQRSTMSNGSRGTKRNMSNAEN
ncbi:hypothetical protein D3C86_2170100 [compost metagenome]